MIDHLTIHVADLPKARAFYLAALAPLGYTLVSEYPDWNLAGIGIEGKAELWLYADGAKQQEHIALRATEKDRVESFHKAGLGAGGKDNGAPGYRKNYSPGYYAAFLLDPSGNNIEVVWHDPGAE